jgi:hypothetical protein
MHTELYCPDLGNLDRIKAIRAIHQALLQLSAIGGQVDVDGTTYDNAPSIAALEACMVEAGHVGFGGHHA